MYVWYTGGNFASFCVGILKLCPDNSRNLKEKKKKRICVGRRRTTTTERKRERKRERQTKNFRTQTHTNTHNTQTRPPPLLITSKSISEEQLFFCGSNVRSVYMQFHQARNVTVAERDLDAGGGGRCLLACLPACLPACRRLFWYARQRLTLRHKIFQRRTPPTNESRILESQLENMTHYCTVQFN